MSRSCFASFPVCVYKFSSHCLNNIIFIDNSLGPLARESPCMRHVKCKYGYLRIRGTQKGEVECSDLVGHDAVTLGECFRTFRWTTAPSSLKVKHS